MVDSNALIEVIESVFLSLILPFMTFLIGTQFGMFLSRVINEIKDEGKDNVKN